MVPNHQPGIIWGSHWKDPTWPFVLFGLGQLTLGIGQHADLALGLTWQVAMENMPHVCGKAIKIPYNQK